VPELTPEEKDREQIDKMIAAKEAELMAV